MTKAPVEDTVLPTGSSVGITVRDDYGRYTGDDYTNIRYSSALSAGVQVWETTSPVLLARETGTLFSYWPHSEDEVDGKTITVAATSDVQTDYMWGLPVAVSKSNRTASITMQHALSAVRIYCKRGSYTGAGEITGVAFGGDCAATAGTLDLTCGALDDLSGQGTMIAPAITAKTITSSYQKVSDIIVVPTSGTNGKVVVTLDGSDYPIEFNTLDLNPGEMSEFYLTANDGELSAADITVGDWTYGDPEGDEIVVSNKVKITGDISNIAFNNTVSEDGTVTIKAMPTSGEKSFTEVEPVTFTGTATLTQSSDIDTGIRTITISDVVSDLVVTFQGTIEYEVIATYDVTADTDIMVIGDMSNVTSIKDFNRVKYDDNDITIMSKQTYKFPMSGECVVKYSIDNAKDRIPSYAFYGCTSMKNVVISENTKHIGSDVFAHCTSLQKIIIPDQVSFEIDKFSSSSGIFRYCSSLVDVKLPKTLTALASSMFSNCTSLRTIKLPETLTTLANYTFENCTSLESITIPSNVTYVGSNCFSYCDNLKLIISYPAVQPNLSNILSNLPSNGTLVVPQGSDYSTWMNSKYFGGKNWTLVYMSE